MHGGSTPAVVAKNERTVMEAKALEAARRFGLPRDISPLDALAEELHRTQGHVDWLAEQIAAHDTNPALLAVYQAERAHLMRITQQAISVGLDDRMKKLQERSLEALETAILATLDDLGMNADKTYVRETLARRLEQALVMDAPDANRDDVIDADIVRDARAPLPEPVVF